MINFTTTYSNQFWKNNMPELSIFFDEIEDLEYWTVKEEEIFPFLVLFETQLNRFKKLSDIMNIESYFNQLIEIFSYLKLGSFFHLIQEINNECPSFLISCLISCKQENNVYQKLFIERFKLLDKHDLLIKLFNDKKINLIRIIISD